METEHCKALASYLPQHCATPQRALCMASTWAVALHWFLDLDQRASHSWQNGMYGGPEQACLLSFLFLDLHLADQQLVQHLCLHCPASTLKYVQTLVTVKRVSTLHNTLQTTSSDQVSPWPLQHKHSAHADVTRTKSHKHIESHSF